MFSFPSPPSAGSRLLDSFAESAHPSLMQRCQLRSQGVHREGPLGPSSSQVLPGASPRRSWILHFLLWGLGSPLLRPARFTSCSLVIPLIFFSPGGFHDQFCRCLPLGFRLGWGGWFVLRMRPASGAPPSLRSYPDLGNLFLVRVICPVLNQSKVQFVNPDQLLFYGDALGPDQGLLGSVLGQVGASARSRAAFPGLPLPSRRQAVVLSGCCCLSQCSFFFQR
jgi:hypothetical protein